MSAAPWLEIVMPTYNRPDALVRALEAIAAQRAGDDLAVIVVDDGSDVSADIAIPAGLRARLPLRVIRQENGGPARARNAGIAASRAEYIGFVDDDVRIDPGWLTGYRAAIAAADGPAAFFGPLLAPANWRPTPWNRWEAETLAVEYARMAAGVYAPTWRQFFTGNAIVRRESLLCAGGFDESFTRAEDVELGLRLARRAGTTFHFVPAGIGWHYAHRTLDSWLRIPRAYGEYDILIDELHPWAGHRAQLTRELARRNPLARLARTPMRNDRVRRAAVFAATRSAAAVSRLGGHRAASRLLSLAYDAEHTNAFFRAAARADDSRDNSREQPIHSASTTGDYPARQ